MLSLMRKHAGSWLIKVVLGAIVVVFVLWGVGSWTSERSGRVATVNGDTITVDEYRMTYKRLIEQVRQSFGNNANEELIRSLQLEQKALDQLVDNLLMRQAASELGLQVSDEDLSQSIRSISAFQVAGAFDPRRYQIILSNNNLTPESFETSQRDALLVQKLNTFITGSVKVSDQEALEWYTWNNTTVNLDFFLLIADRYPDMEIAAEETQSYFDAHKDSYKTDPALKVRYLKFAPTSFESQVSVSDDEIAEYYDEHPDEFQNPKTVEARHVLIKVDPEASPEDVAKSKTRIEAVLQKARGGEDFAELAKAYSEGPSKDKGGHLGTFKRETMVKPFSDKAFSMKAGEISEPVKTRFGWHIIKVEKVNEANTMSLADATGRIRQILTVDASKNMAYDTAEAVYDATFEGEQLESVAAAQNLSLITTDFFTRRTPPQGVQKKTEFANSAFSLIEGEVSDVKDFGDGYYLMELVEKRPSEIPELAAVEEKVKSDLLDQKRDEQARADAEAVLAALKDGGSLQEVGEQFELKPEQTGFFKRNDSIPNIGYERALSQAAFELSDQSKLPPEIIKGSKGYYVIQLSQRKTPSPDGFQKEKTGIKDQLLQQKKFKAFEAWLENIKNRSEIVVEDNFLNS
ncbi:MAG: SurA N-terminal domain-containing protein [Desulfobacterales bacterium]|nr:SurA N-terminal domain-containing protein [Desulfobacterales bacterium]